MRREKKGMKKVRKREKNLFIQRKVSESFSVTTEDQKINS